ncbi:PREDICTED: retinaldehyde-binding protein 1-like [Dinoponera quadriceps]|uniref:Retinaldehyde-binding protein 1-like n=1 Tax=Dinoponera quadriceps TaxID=609295 RepID=A0A6P3Y903_DINQU|nr:PREDICTED: retinaldehyde-binding protein 1-like [Dinoponera quadriceps]
MKEFVWVADTTGFTIGHVGRLNLQSIKKIMYYIQDTLPIRLKAVHIINTSPIVEMAYNMIKPFISAELIHLREVMKWRDIRSDSGPIQEQTSGNITSISPRVSILSRNSCPHMRNYLNHP